MLFSNFFFLKVRQLSLKCLVSDFKRGSCCIDVSHHHTLNTSSREGNKLDDETGTHLHEVKQPLNQHVALDHKPYLENDKY